MVPVFLHYPRENHMARAPRPRDPERPAPTNDARRSMMIGVGVGSQYSQVKYIYIYIYMAMLLSRVQLGWGLRC
jgi:hypothetical protein